MSRLLDHGGSLPERVLVVRALSGLGDLLCSVPAWRALRHALPHATITLLGLPPAETILAHTGYIDELMPFTGYPGILESPSTDPGAITRALGDIQSRRFDLAVQMHGSGVASNALTALLGARVTAGFFLPGQYCPDPDHFLPYPGDEPEVRRHLHLMAFLGATVTSEELEFRVLPEDEDERARIQEWAGLDGAPYACMHPGASIAARRWPAEGFGRVGDALAEQGLRVVVTGVSREREVTARVVAAMRAPAVDAAGMTSIGGLAALVSGSRITITNDTGTSHLAAALGVPSVVIFTSSDPRRWAPLDVERHVAVASQPPSCETPSPREERRCLLDGCTERNAEWAPRPPSERSVLQAVQKLLDTTPARAVSTPRL